MFLKISRVSFVIKLLAQGIRPATLLEKRLWYRCFPVNFEKFLRTPFWWPWKGTVLFYGFSWSVLRIWHSSQKGQTVLGSLKQFSEVLNSSQKSKAVLGSLKQFSNIILFKSFYIDRIWLWGSALQVLPSDIR